MSDFFLIGRAVPEWRGKRPESMPPKSVIDRIFLRQGGRCAITGKKFMPGDVKHVDHITPLKDGGLNVESNLQLITVQAHKAKTSAENAARAKERRVRLKHQGLWPASPRPLQSRGFQKRAPQEQEG